MGIRMAPAYVDLFMKYLKRELLDRAPKKLNISLRFIDDMFLIRSHGKEELDRFVTMINNFQ